MTKYGIWKTRYTQNVALVFEDWVRQNGVPVLFSTEYAALEYKHGEEMKVCNDNIEFEVRQIEVPE
ncbi:hypothetical protein SAMN02910447_03344 [Ruminococcus sp. YE71]|uniref:hypothetical protein n=1 Tax=Ruminococcus sp. YE71 TaxID=244362 RepID=UPI000908A3D5|nr:hypothetical protein [Ruminococcus sp. YE71]SFW51200.1 hypothetical protein SAMN02910447_03344 [Ruminococcus sp. YE71]